MKYYIGLDWGARKIGVAFGDDETRQAFGLVVIENGAGTMDALDTIAHEYETDTFIVGLSENREQHDNEEVIKSFGKKIEAELGKKVLFAPEMFSTRQAHDNLKNAGKKNITQNDDIESARIILQEFLDTVPECSVT